MQNPRSFNLIGALETERLVLRPFRASDRPAFAELNADPEVCRFLPGVLPRDESDALAERLERSFEAHGFGYFAVEVRGGAPFVGFCGLAPVGFGSGVLPTAGPAVEVGWRLARGAWGNGYATEAARASLRLGFETLGLAEIVSFTVPENLRSRRVMERIGLVHEPAHDFDHPRLPEGHPLRRHVLYRMRAPGP